MDLETVIAVLSWDSKKFLIVFLESHSVIMSRTAPHPNDVTQGTQRRRIIAPRFKDSVFALTKGQPFVST